MIMKFKNWFPKISKTAWIAQSSDIIGNVEIGEDSAVWFGSILRGDVHFIKIGKRTNIQDLSVLHVTHFTKPDMSDGNPLIIGDNVTVGHQVMLHGCTIEDACLIGIHSTILDGAVIGKESIVGAGALITSNKKFPPQSLILGSPAKLIRKLTDEEVKSLYISANNYVKYKNQFMKEEK